MTYSGQIMCIWCEQMFPTKKALQIHLMDECKKSPMAGLLAENLKKKRLIAELEAKVAEHEALLQMQLERELPYIERWAADKGKLLSAPDYGELMGWIMDENEILEKKLAWQEEEIARLQFEIAAESGKREDATQTTAIDALMRSGWLLLKDHPEMREDDRLFCLVDRVGKMAFSDDGVATQYLDGNDYCVAMVEGEE